MVFDPSYRGIICIFLIAYFIYEGYISRYYKIAIVLILFFSGFQYNEKQAQTLNLNYKLINTNISQDQKFLQENLKSNSDILIQDILQAINEKELVILPETAFAFDLKIPNMSLCLKNYLIKSPLLQEHFMLKKSILTIALISLKRQCLYFK